MITIDDPMVVAHFAKHPSPTATDVLRSFIDLSSPLDEHAVLSEVRALKGELQQDLVATTHKSIEAMHAQSFKGLMEAMERRDAALMERIKGTKDEALRDEVLALKAAQKALFEEVKECNREAFKVKSSSQAKGAASEQEVLAALTRLYPTAAVEDFRGHTGKGDFMMRRPGKPDVMFENKCYERNVDLVESTKFIRDALSLKCSAVMMSQKSGIVNKEHFRVEVQDRIVLVYLHHVNNDEGVMRSAVDVIDQLEARLAGVSAEEREMGVAVEKATLDGINAEYQENLLKHQTAMATMVEAHKMIQEQVRQLKHQPNLASFLNLTYPQKNASAKSFVCVHCARSFTSQGGLNGHMKSHK